MNGPTYHMGLRLSMMSAAVDAVAVSIGGELEVRGQGALGCHFDGWMWVSTKGGVIVVFLRGCPKTLVV